MAAEQVQGRRRTRDFRIDLARGITMLVIFLVHVPDNSWADYIPARFGFSSGAEAFVLCSGIACGLAFGGTYRREGWRAGTRRIGLRVGQLWAVQTLGFLAFALMLSAIDGWLGGDFYRERYALGYIQDRPLEATLSLAILRFSPIYFEILPLYIVVLAATPLMVAAASRSPWLALGLSGSLWLFVQFVPVNLVAHPVDGRNWYFNPLAWQFLFFIGFGASAGWFATPRPTAARIRLAAAVILACVPLTFWGAHRLWPELERLFLAIYPGDAITTLHWTRVAHVLLLAWLFMAVLEPVRERLASGVLRPILVVGQQSLITFVAGMFLSTLVGVALDVTGRHGVTLAAFNLAGFAAIVAIAYLARAIKARGRPVPSPKEPLTCRTVP